MRALASFVVFCVFVIIACSKEPPLVANKRDDGFYTRFVNSESDASGIPANLSSLKLLQVGDDYPIRVALFEGGRVYYQVDKLGNGNGLWEIKDGALHISAERPVFDMHFYVSGSDEGGDTAVIRFMDRHGTQSYNLDFRNPAVIPQEKLPQLRQFSESTKGI